MKNKLQIISILITTMFMSVIYADPWFTGPLLINSAQTTPIGEGGIAIPIDSNRNFGIYEKNYNFVSTPRFSADHVLPEFFFGVAEDIDMELAIDYTKNQNQGQSHSNLGDTGMQMGFQLLRQNNSNKRSDVRITLSEEFPTGRYDRLNPRLYTTDGTGIGSYQTCVDFLVQHLMQLSETHYVNMYGSIALTYSSPVALNGLSIYGGTSQTKGHISPGNSITLDMAAEYTITQNWVAVMETYIYAQQASSFTGIIANDMPSFIQKNAQSRSLGKHGRLRDITFNNITPSKHNIGSSQHIGSGNVAEITIAPALEYNFSQHVGIIGGTWFTLSGKNTPAFISTIVTITMSW